MLLQSFYQDFISKCAFVVDNQGDYLSWVGGEAGMRVCDKFAYFVMWLPGFL